MATTTPFLASYAPSITRGSSTHSARPGADQPIRLTRRGKVVVTLGASLACLGLLQVTGGVQAVASGISGGPATASVVAQPGETLWEIAKRVAPGADPRATVAAIRELNGLDRQVSLLAGQSLTVPR